MANETKNLQTVRRYLDAIEQGVGFEELAEFFTPDVVQIEYPNRLVVNGARRDLAQLREAGERGKDVVESQRYEIRTAIASGDTVALEVEWTATLKVPVGALSAGGQMRAHFGVFLELRDGRIAAQRNYDCFEPF
jgi:ketosteroid isomerase-like protein